MLTWVGILFWSLIGSAYSASTKYSGGAPGASGDVSGTSDEGDGAVVECQ